MDCISAMVCDTDEPVSETCSVALRNMGNRGCVYVPDNGVAIVRLLEGRCGTLSNECCFSDVVSEVLSIAGSVVTSSLQKQPVTNNVEQQDGNGIMLPLSGLAVVTVTALSVAAISVSVLVGWIICVRRARLRAVNNNGNVIEENVDAMEMQPMTNSELMVAEAGHDAEMETAFDNSSINRNANNASHQLFNVDGCTYAGPKTECGTIAATAAYSSMCSLNEI